jgi:hypothetical protein
LTPAGGFFGIPSPPFPLLTALFTHLRKDRFAPFIAAPFSKFFSKTGEPPKKPPVFPVFVRQSAQTKKNNTSSLQAQKPGCSFQPGFF